MISDSTEIKPNKLKMKKTHRERAEKLSHGSRLERRELRRFLWPAPNPEEKNISHLM